MKNGVGLNLIISLSVVIAASVAAANFVPVSFWRSFYSPNDIFGTGVDGSLTLTGAGQPSSCGPTNPCLLNGSLINSQLTRLTANANVGNTSISVSGSAGFTVGRRVLIIQMEGTSAGTYEILSLSSVGSGSLGFSTGLRNHYSSGGNTQVILLREYANLTLNSGATLSAPTYNSTSGTGGVLALMVNGTLTINNNGGSGVPGTISVGGGFGVNPTPIGFAANNGPGAGSGLSGGSNMSPSDPSRLIMGSGGGSGVGGGAVLLMARNLVLNGQVVARGGNAPTANTGGGSGGTVSIITEALTTTATCGAISAPGGFGNGTGLAGGEGKAFVLYRDTIGCKPIQSPTVENYLKYRGL